MYVGNICSRRVVTVPGKMSATESASIMLRRHVGALLVINEDKTAIGIVTDRDLTLDIIASGGDANTVKVNDVMSSPLISCREKDSVADATRLMRDHGIRRLPVINEAKQPLGMFTLDDAVDHLALMLGNLVGVMKSEFNREKKDRD